MMVNDERLESRTLHTQRLETLGRIVGGIAHDFNNLLTVISSYSQLVEAELPAGSASRVDINEVIQAASSAADLTRQLLSFGCSRVIALQTLDVNATVSRIVSMLRRVIGEDVRIETRLSPAVCAVVADRSQLEQVVMNLAVNARDAMPDGGVLSISTSTVMVDEAPVALGRSLPPGEFVSIVVEDTGVGISENSLKRIFEAFYTTKKEGVGLGLATVMSIVENLGGDVRVESKPGEGSRFTILLPCLRADSPQHTVESSTPPPPRGVESILIIEDELAVRKAVRRILGRLGYLVSEAASGADAMSVIGRLPRLPDLVLMDVILPGENGSVVARRLLQQCLSLRVLFMSGYSAEELLERGIAIPRGALLEKPLTIEILADAVRQSLDAPAS